MRKYEESLRFSSRGKESGRVANACCPKSSFPESSRWSSIYSGNKSSRISWRYERYSCRGKESLSAHGHRLKSEDRKVKEALRIFKIAMSSYFERYEIDKGGSESDSMRIKEVEGKDSIPECLEPLLTSLFGISDTKLFLEYSLPPIKEMNLIRNLSQDVKWDVGHSVSSEMKLIMCQSNCFHDGFPHPMMALSLISFSCFDAILRLQHESLRPKDMSDQNLCDCAFTLIEILRMKRFGDLSDDNWDVVTLKASLFSCLAKILALSAMNWTRNTNNRRVPLHSWGAEKTVDLVVTQCILPFFEILGSLNDTTLNLSKKNMCAHGAMECLYILLRDPCGDSRVLEYTDGKLKRNTPQITKHASAMLAPLVLDILPDGTERQCCNPIQFKVLRCIISGWNWSCQLIHENNYDEINRVICYDSCQCICAAFNALHAQRRGKVLHQRNSEDGAKVDVDVSSIVEQIQRILQTRQFQEYHPQFLDLLTSVCYTFPMPSARHWYLFLEELGSTQHSNDISNSATLLLLLKFGNDALEAKAFDNSFLVHLPNVLRSISALTSSMPLTIWIPSEGKISSRLSSSNFTSRVQNSMLNLISRIHDLMQSLKSILSSGNFCSKDKCGVFQAAMIHSFDLAAELCTKLPFTAENTFFLQQIMCLLTCAGDIFVISLKKMEMGLSHSNDSIFQLATAVSSNLITKCLGNITIDTAKTATSTAARLWLCDPSSCEFIGILLSSPSTEKVSSLSKNKIEILSHVAKAAPLALTREPHNVALFCNMCSFHCNNGNDEESRAYGLKLIESFVIGRKHSSSASEDGNIDSLVVTESLFPLLFNAVEDRCADIRAQAASSFAPLLRSDWRTLLVSDSSLNKFSVIDWKYLEPVLDLCSSTFESSASVRSAACKSVGEIYCACFECFQRNNTATELEFPFTVELSLSFAQKICDVMKIAIEDSSSSVRSMALFAVGNVALASKKLGIEKNIFPGNLLFPPVCACVHDKDEKVTTNAVRTVGHMSHFVYGPESCSNIDFSNKMDLFELLLSALSKKIRLALDDASGDHTRELTWKQRNSAKKQARGSSTTLGLMLASSDVVPHISGAVVEDALSQLFRCIQLSSSVNEKILVAAVTALQKVQLESWEKISKKCNSIGQGLATCFLFLCEENLQQTSKPIHHNIQDLLSSLLASAKRNDFCTMFLIQEKIPFSVDYFYRWLVSNSTDAAILKEISSATDGENVELNVDVSAIQMFLNSKVQQNVRADSPVKFKTTNLSNEQVDEFDEL